MPIGVMTITNFKNKRYISLTAGLITLYISFLLFAGHTDIFLFLLLIGLITSIISYLSIFFGKGTKKSKIIWTVLILSSIGMIYLIKPALIKTSYLIYLHSNQEGLSEINDILIRHEGVINIDRNTIAVKKGDLTGKEIERLKKLREQVGAYIIWKSNSDIYYGLYGFLDFRNGLSYSCNGNIPRHQFVHTKLTNNWYY